MNREELDRHLRQSTPREKEVLQGIPLEELHRQDTCRFAKAGQGSYIYGSGGENRGEQAGSLCGGTASSA